MVLTKLYGKFLSSYRSKFASATDFVSYVLKLREEMGMKRHLEGVLIPSLGLKTFGIIPPPSFLKKYDKLAAQSSNDTLKENVL